MASPGAAGAGRVGGGGTVINSEGFLKFQADQEKFTAQHVELYMRYLGHDSHAEELTFEKANSLALQAKLNNITHKHGNAYIKGIQPCFDILKAVTLTLHGIGFVKMLSLCSMTSSLAV